MSMGVYSSSKESVSASGGTMSNHPPILVHTPSSGHLKTNSKSKKKKEKLKLKGKSRRRTRSCPVMDPVLQSKNATMRADGFEAMDSIMITSACNKNSQKEMPSPKSPRLPFGVHKYSKGDSNSLVNGYQKAEKQSFLPLEIDMSKSRPSSLLLVDVNKPNRSESLSPSEHSKTKSRQYSHLLLDSPRQNSILLPTDIIRPTSRECSISPSGLERPKIREPSHLAKLSCENLPSAAAHQTDISVYKHKESVKLDDEKFTCLKSRDGVKERGDIPKLKRDKTRSAIHKTTKDSTKLPSVGKPPIGKKKLYHKGESTASPSRRRSRHVSPSRYNSNKSLVTSHSLTSLADLTSSSLTSSMDSMRGNQTSKDSDCECPDNDVDNSQKDEAEKEQRDQRKESATYHRHILSPKDIRRAQKKPHVLVAIKPDNQDIERGKFFRFNFHYNPQFEYKHMLEPKVLKKFSKASDKLMPLAVRIMNNAMEKYGSYEEFESQTGGKMLTRSFISEAIKKYLRREGMETEIAVNLSDDLVSRACMTQVKGQATLQVRTSNMRERWMEGLLRHEIGTHYLRSCNNRVQLWSNARRRKQLELGPVNPTEEGLASLHSVIFREDPCLWRAALLYYTIYMATQMSFSQLFKNLKQFVSDPFVRWDYCLRAKRGQTDTANSGAFCKDQVYLIGALEILKNRHEIDFHLLIQLGKIAYQDIDRLTEIAELQNTRIPAFMEDEEFYRQKLEEIVVKNGLTDEDLEKI